MPDAKLILVIAGVGAACLALGLPARGRRRDESMLVRRSPLDSAAARPGETISTYGGANFGIDLRLGRDLEQLLSEGKHVSAIELVRERTGWGLEEAKEAVERLEGLRQRLKG